MATRMQQRRGTAAQWTSANPILAAGELGFETDTNKFKVGDGTNHWADLNYFVDATNVSQADQEAIDAAVAAVIGASPALLDTLEEISAAIGNDESFASTISTALAGKTSNTQFNGHVNTTTEVHGISDTANLVYTANLDSAMETADTNAQGMVDALSDTLTESINGLTTTVSDHTSDTTAVHGISDTANLVYTSDSRLSDERTPSAASVVASKIATDAVETDKIKNNAVTNAKLADDAVDTAEIKDGAVTDSKLAGSIAQSKITNLETDLSNKQDKVSGVSSTEIGYLDGVTSSIQTQLDAKAPIASPTLTGTTTTSDLVVNGDFTVNGTNFAASATSITIEDNIVQLAHQNAANTVDLGLVVAYNDGAAKHAGIVRDVSDSKWKLFKGVTTEPSTTVDFTQGSLDDLKVAAFEATTVTPSSGVVFSDGTQTKEGVPSRTPIIKKTASYKLSSLDERDSLIEVDSSSSVTITIPTNSAVAFPIGTTLDVLGVNTGLITIEGDSGVTVNATPGLKLRTQWSSCTLFKREENSWVVYGDLSA